MTGGLPGTPGVPIGVGVGGAGTGGGYGVGVGGMASMFSPGVTMSPGGFWGRPVNAAVGAPVAGKSNSGNTTTTNSNSNPNNANGNGGAAGEGEVADYFPPVQYLQQTDGDYFPVLPPGPGGSRLANEILTGGGSRPGTGVGDGGSSSQSPVSSGVGEGVNGIEGRMAAFSLGSGSISGSGSGSRSGSVGKEREEDVFWVGGRGTGTAHVPVQRQTSFSHAKDVPGMLHRTGSDPMRQRNAALGVVRPTTSGGAASTVTSTSVWGPEVSGNELQGLGGERRASFAEVVDGAAMRRGSGSVEGWRV